MKNTLNTFVLAGIISAGCMSGIAMAAAPQGAPDAIPHDQFVDGALKATDDHNEKMDELIREKELLEVEGALSKLRLEKEKSELDIKKIRGLPVPPPTGAPSAAMVGAVDSSIQGMPYLPNPQSTGIAKERNRSEDNPLDRVFVTRVYGVGGVRNVTVYFDNGIFTGTNGDEVISGLKIVKVTDNGAVLSYKGKTKNINLTTQGLAYSRSQVKQKAERNTPSVNQSMAPGFGSMAQEIAPDMNSPQPHPR